MKNQITLENIENWTVSFDEIQANKWIFEDDEGNIPLEVREQVFPLSGKATIFLRKFEETQKILSVYQSSKYFKTVEKLNFSHLMEKEIKEWLYEKGIPFDHFVIWRDGTVGFIITWKMVIKYAYHIFLGKNGLIWDKTLNWTLGFEHNDVLFWSKDRIYNNDTEFKEKERIDRLLENNTLNK